MFTVEEIMIREPHTLGPDNSLLEARKLMADHHVRHIPIVNDSGTLVGLVSQRDVLAAGDSSMLESNAGGGNMEQFVALSAIMSWPVHTVGKDDSLRGAAMLLRKNRLGCLPVLRDNQLVGIITDSDFVTIAIHLLEQLEESEPEEEED
jgi:CBS domain-containing membrane protein